jgi:FkbM family methyltransferase
VNAVLSLVRRLATAPGFRLLTRLEPLLRVSFALRASLVRTPARFALAELLPGERLGVYRLRASPVRVAVRHHTADVLVLDEIFSQREYELPPPVRDALSSRQPPTVADLGANIGLFGAFVLSEYGNARIVAVEADAANAAVHERTIAANDRAATWTLTCAYAATAEGTTRFAGGRFALSRAVDGEGTVDIRTIDVFPLLEPADFVKIDVEGAEWPLLADPRFRSLQARAIVLEYHAEGAPSSKPGADAERALRAAGFTTVRGASKPQFGAGVIWGWRS